MGELKMKLFVIEQWIANEWKPMFCHRGKFQDALTRAQCWFGLCSRVRRVKTSIEAIRQGLPFEGGFEEIKWVN